SVRFRLEFLQTALRAEIVLLSLMPEKMPRAGAVHLHAANRVRGGKVVLRRGFELFPTRFAAEVKQPAFMYRAWLASLGIHRHAADGIAHHCRQAGVGRARAVRVRMIVMVMRRRAVHDFVPTGKPVR